VRELAAIALISFICLCLAWAYEADFFAIVFAAGAAIAGIEAVRRSL
jgi:hypothetical protein